MDILVKTLQVIFALSLLVFVHESGHFLFARLFRIRVDKFYLFFNLYFSLVRFKKVNGKWRFKFLSRNVPEKYRVVKDSDGKEVKDNKGKPILEEISLDSLPANDWRREEDNTEYGLGWLPIGGYCKVAGMIDESMDKESMAREPQPFEYRSKPAWQRFFVMFGGVLFNLIWAVILYSAMLYTWGERYLQNRDAIYGVDCSNLAKEIGFRDGDIILAYDHITLESEDFRNLSFSLLRNRPQTVTVLRDGDTVRFHFDDSYIPRLLKDPILFELRTDPNAPFVVLDIPDSSHNSDSGLLAGDKVIAICGTPVNTIAEVQSMLPLYANKTIEALIERETEMLEIPLHVNHEGKIGILLQTSDFNITTKTYSFFSAIPAGTSKSYSTVANYLRDLKLIFSPKTKAYKSVGSVIAIGNIFPSFWSWSIFWNITAFLSVMFAVINLLPIPALDGGHILFVLYEMITGRKPGDKFLEYAQMVGMFILFAIMILAFGNDIFRLFN